MNKHWQRITALAVVAAALQSAPASEKLGAARSAVSRWVDVERTISREALAWEDKRTLLHDLIAVAKTENQTLAAEIAKADEVTGEAEKRRAELVKEREDNSKRSKQISEFLRQAEVRVRKLFPRLPKPLQDKIEPMVQRLPKDSQDTTIGMAVRMQTVMGCLAEIQRFDRTVLPFEELLTTPAGETREVQTIYFGLGAAYYVTTDKSDAGIGKPTDTGWVWQPQPDLADTIREAIISAEGKARDAQFLSLPVSLKETEK